MSYYKINNWYIDKNHLNNGVTPIYNTFLEGLDDWKTIKNRFRLIKPSDKKTKQPHPHPQPQFYFFKYDC